MIEEHKNQIDEAVPEKKGDALSQSPIETDSYFATAVTSLKGLEGAILHDEPLNMDDLVRFSEDLKKTRVEVGGELLSLNEIGLAENRAELERNFSLWKKIREGGTEQEISSVAYNITFLPSAVAKALANHQGYLIFSSLKSLSPEAAEELAKMKEVGGRSHFLAFNCVEEISDEAAEKISHFDGTINFPCIKKLTKKSAEYLVASRPSINIGNLSELSPEVAQPLSKFSGHSFTLGTEILHDDVAEILSKLKVQVLNLHTQTLSPIAAKHLGTFKGGTLGISDVKQLSDEALQFLAERKKHLMLLDLTSLSDKGAEYLAKINHVHFSNLKEISDQGIEHFARSAGKISGSKELNDRISAAKERLGIVKK